MVAKNLSSLRGRDITHVIFDMDGLLLDSEIYCIMVQEKILERFGKKFDWSVRPKMMGKKAMEVARIFVEEAGLIGQLTPEGFLEAREGMLQELFPHCRLMPGMESDGWLCGEERQFILVYHNQINYSQKESDSDSNLISLANPKYNN